MINILFFGLLLGAIAAALDKAQGTIDIVRFAILATVGALSGKFLASMIAQTYELSTKSTEAAGILVGAIAVILLRKLLFPNPYSEKPTAIE